MQLSIYIRILNFPLTPKSLEQRGAWANITDAGNHCVLQLLSIIFGYFWGIHYQHSGIPVPTTPVRN